ncbi:RES family NAD+ phosphorylase [Vibrio tubiashii]|uniref:RES family NAD+ phosphorylase n=1 Tax=Vibrio tubiashii TaxID=29498 RepID=UPI001EFE9A83|nr:RES family NAD+ phosphorylase [Vibrio tubiashii]MCG9578212.1 RES family NAD+ phosphorylase [Vibrio tubiashii]
MSFKSWRSYMRFSYAVKNKSRYMLDSESQKFLEAIKDTCQSRLIFIPAGTEMWRAQAGHDDKAYYQDEIYIDDFPVPYSESRMKPLSNSASEGRANPKGIPCLYLASTKETAMSEVRPWLGSIVSVARFSSLRELRIIDFSKHHGDGTRFYIQEPSDAEKTEAVWRDMDNAFSEPVTHSDTKSDYAPTQVIAELIKSLNYDGIAFKSSLSEGYNFALFDLNCAGFEFCELHETKEIKFSFGNVSTPFNQF